ncbi:MAG: NHLP bacteriocin system secretion protein [Myxococcota bacterium]
MSEITTSQLQHALKVVHRRHWIPALILSALVLSALAYMIFGRVPVTVEGNAMFMTPATVVSFQATASGQIRTWHVRVGDRVTRGQLLAELEQPLIANQLAQTRAKLADLQSRDATLSDRSDAYLELELAGLARKKTTLQNRIDSLKAENRRIRRAVQAVQEQKQAYLARRESDLVAMRELAEKRRDELVDKVALTTDLMDEGLRSEDQLIAVKRQQIAQEDQVASVDLQIVQAALDRARAAEVLLDSMNRIAEVEQQTADLEHEYQTLLSREVQLSEQAQSARYVRQMEISEVEHSIERYAKQLTEEREVRAEHDGRIIELTRSHGERVGKGAVLGSIDTRTDADELAAVAYFKLRDGKKIEPGMTIRLTPAVAEHDRFGGIVGTVESVSEYPVTTAGAARTIGNTEASRLLTEDGHFVAVYATLRSDDTPSGYQWERFDGPDIELSAGTLASARVDTESVRPVSFVIPGLADI